MATALLALPGATEPYRVPKDAAAQAAIVIFMAAWTLKHLWAADLGEAFRSLREVPLLPPLTCFIVWMPVTASPNSRFKEEFKHFIHHGDTAYTEMHGEPDASVKSPCPL